jgi:hypothetical protein
MKETVKQCAIYEVKLHYATLFRILSGLLGASLSLSLSLSLSISLSLSLVVVYMFPLSPVCLACQSDSKQPT